MSGRDPVIGVIFLALAAISCGTAALLGGRDGRWVAFLYMAAVGATYFAEAKSASWASVQLPVFLIDAALLFGLVAVALNSRRYWTIWIAGLHVLTVASHGSVLLLTGFDARAYFVLETFWAPVKLLVLLIGVLMDWGRSGEARRLGSS